MLKLFSPAFEDGGHIPVRHTCDGINTSPPLAWKEMPPGCKSLALVCKNQNATSGPRIHWILYNLPATTSEVPENVPPEEKLSNGARHGLNDFREYGYCGPWRSNPTQKYAFSLYALRSSLVPSTQTKLDELLVALQGQILEESHLSGTY
jgi:Raf kinase inhibitor-like YbhB/YbcL family protein